MPAKGFPIPHSSLSRPRLVPVDSLPPGAQVNRSRTSWQHICDTLIKNEGQWFELTRKYTALATAVASARRTLESDYPSDVASRLESASLLDIPNDTVTVYLRIAEANVEEEEESNGTLFPEDDGA